MTTDNKTLADVQPGGRVRLGDGLPPLPKAGYVTGGDFGHEAHNAFTPEQMRDYALAALAAQPSPGATALGIPIVVDPTVPPDTFEVRQPSPGCQDALPPIREDQPLRGDEPIGEQHDARLFNRGWNACREAAAALAARQPVGEPEEHACSNCDRKHVEAICPTCAGIAWDNGRLHEFHEVRELSTSLGEGVLDHLLPDEWHEKPLLRFQGAYDEGDDSVGISPRSANVLAEDQNGTVLGDYLAARAAKEGSQ